MVKVITAADARANITADSLNSIAEWNEEMIEKDTTQVQKHRHALQAAKLREVASELEA